MDLRPLWQQRLLAHWYDNKPLLWPIHLALLGLSKLYKWLATHRTQPRKGIAPGLPPVIVIGNLIVGGAGKTPIVAALAKRLKQQGFQPGIISRGYGRTEHSAGVLTPATIDKNIDIGTASTAQQFGDEPVWLATNTQCPVAVSANRHDALCLLVKQYPQTNVVISDDGLSHTALQRLFEIVVFDQRGIGNGQLLPAGPMRQPLARLQSADMIISNTNARFNKAVPHYTSKMVLQSLTQHNTGQQMSLANWQVQFGHNTTLAFAGMSNPAKFFSLLSAVSINAQSVLLPDHFSYPPNFTHSLKANLLLTTGKDAVKLQKNDPRLWIVDIDVQLPEAAYRLIEDYLRGH